MNNWSQLLSILGYLVDLNCVSACAEHSMQKQKVRQQLIIAPSDNCGIFANYLQTIASLPYGGAEPHQNLVWMTQLMKEVNHFEKIDAGNLSKNQQIMN